MQDVRLKEFFSRHGGDARLELQSEWAVRVVDSGFEEMLEYCGNGSKP